jgi:hypothetical protein
MLGQERMDRELLDAAASAGHLVTAGSMFTFLAQDTITQLVTAIRKAGRLFPGAPKLISEVCTGHDCSQPGGRALRDVACGSCGWLWVRGLRLSELFRNRSYGARPGHCPWWCARCRLRPGWLAAYAWC